MSSIRLVSCWSKAGVGTSIVLEYQKPGAKKRPRIVLDLGATPIYEDSIRAGTVFISHGHLDHVGAIFSHARAHGVSCGGSCPTYYVPEAIRPQVEQARDAMLALDGDRRPSQMKIVGVQPGDEVQLGKKGLEQLFARVFAVKHTTVPAVGYVIGSRQEPVLKEEYRGLGKQEIRQLISQGVAVKTEPREVLEIAYTGDTSLDGLLLETNVSNQDEREQRSALYLEQAFQCNMLFCEATMLDDSKKAKDMSTERGHMHIQDVARALQGHSFDNGKKLVLLHMSARYGAKQALDHIADALPNNMTNRCLVAISSLLPAHQRRGGEPWTRNIQHNGCILLSDYIAARKQGKRKQR